jgi:hypothetical protein
MFTLSFLVKATNSWMYIYFQQGQQQLIQNCGFYVPNGTHYFPVVVRKIYEVKLDNEKTTFTTSSASSYPIKLRNIILSAQKIN